jgi:hypothetical protein
LKLASPSTFGSILSTLTLLFGGKSPSRDCFLAPEAINADGIIGTAGTGGPSNSPGTLLNLVEYLRFTRSAVLSSFERVLTIDLGIDSVDPFATSLRAGPEAGVMLGGGCRIDNVGSVGTGGTEMATEFAVAAAGAEMSVGALILSFPDLFRLSDSIVQYVVQLQTAGLVKRCETCSWRPV